MCTAGWHFAVGVTGIEGYKDASIPHDAGINLKAASHSLVAPLKRGQRNPPDIPLQEAPALVALSPTMATREAWSCRKYIALNVRAGKRYGAAHVMYMRKHATRAT